MENSVWVTLGGGPCAPHTGTDINQTWRSRNLLNGEVDPPLKAASAGFHVEVKANQQNTASNLRGTQKCNGLTLQWRCCYLMLAIQEAGFNQLQAGKTAVLSQDSLPTHTRRISTQGTFSDFFLFFPTLTEPEYVHRVSSLWDFVISLRDSIWLLSGGQEQGSRESQWCNYKPFCPPQRQVPRWAAHLHRCQIGIKEEVQNVAGSLSDCQIPVMSCTDLWTAEGLNSHMFQTLHCLLCRSLKCNAIPLRRVLENSCFVLQHRSTLVSLQRQRNYNWENSHSENWVRTS